MQTFRVGPEVAFKIEVDGLDTPIHVWRLRACDYEALSAMISADDARFLAENLHTLSHDGRTRFVHQYQRLCGTHERMAQALTYQLKWQVLTLELAMRDETHERKRLVIDNLIPNTLKEMACVSAFGADFLVPNTPPPIEPPEPGERLPRPPDISDTGPPAQNPTTPCPQDAGEQGQG